LKAILKGIGVVGGFGTGIQTLEKVLLNRGPTVESLAVPDPQTLGGQFFVPVDTRQIQDRFPSRALRRIDHFSRMALLAAVLALEDAGKPEVNDRMGVIVATGYGATRTTFAFLDSVLEGGDSCASPTLFSGSVHNTAAAQISMLMGICGPNLTVSRFDLSISEALVVALIWLAEGRVTSVLVGGVDEWCPVLGHCYHRFFGKNDLSPMRPLDPDRQSAVVAEGAAFFLLLPEEDRADGYGVIESVTTGCLRDDAPVLPEDALILLGADGHPVSARRYARFVPKNRKMAAYAPYYGSLPIGMGFDMAIAGLTLRRKRIFPMPEIAVKDVPIDTVPTDSVAWTGKVCCLKITPFDTYGMITLATQTGNPGN